jgi:hypothetical protein
MRIIDKRREYLTLKAVKFFYFRNEKGILTGEMDLVN